MIVSIGEALIDNTPSGSAVGGGPLNTALAVTRLGSPAAFLGGISSDSGGRRILEFLVDNCVIFDPVFCNTDAPTMTADAVPENGTVAYTFTYKNTSAFSISAGQLKEAFNANSDINCVVLGSVSFTSEKVRAAVSEALPVLKDPVLFLDPNIRPAAVSDMESYRAALDRWAGRCHIVKASSEDLKLWGRTEQELLQICRCHLLVTRGADGSTWHSKSFTVHAPAFSPVQPIVDTIGCGDTFNGAVLSWLDRHGLMYTVQDISPSQALEALTFANRCAALNATVPGCHPPALSELN